MLSAHEARLLDALTIGARGAVGVANAGGARMTRARGFSTDFEDFRRYQPGDDPRAIDWTIRARLGQLVVRVFRSHARLRVHLLVDRSGSMRIGAPSKLTAATRIAAALAYIACGTGDEFGLAAFDGTIHQHVTPATGQVQLWRVLSTLGSVSAGGRSAQSHALSDYASLARSPGLVIVISDFFQEGGPLGGLQTLLQRGLLPAVVHIGASEDLDAAGTEEIEIVDSEDPERAPLVVESRAVRAYHARVRQLSTDLSRYCRENGLPYVSVDTTTDVEHFLLACQPAGLLSART